MTDAEISNKVKSLYHRCETLWQICRIIRDKIDDSDKDRAVRIIARETRSSCELVSKAWDNCYSF